MQYTEEDYAKLYSDLPEGLKDLVLSGRLAILVSAIGTRHGLNPDQVADLEPAIEDVCLGLITLDELVENIQKSIPDIDTRVANRIAAEAEIEILRPFGADLILARTQKEELDREKDKKANTSKKSQSTNISTNLVNQNLSENTSQKINTGPKDLSGHANAQKAVDFYEKGSTDSLNKNPAGKNNTSNSFDWDKDFAVKSKEGGTESEENNNTMDNLNTNSTNGIPTGVEKKLDALTESINKLVGERFGVVGQKTDENSNKMDELLKRLEKTEKENEANKKLLQTLNPNTPVGKIFSTPTLTATSNTSQNSEGNNEVGIVDNSKDSVNKVNIDKQRKVDISKNSDVGEKNESNIKINSVSNNIPIEKKEKTEPQIFSSAVSKDSIDTILESRMKEGQKMQVSQTLSNISATPSTKKTISLDELLAKTDEKIKDVTPKPTTLVFSGKDEERKIDIKDMSQKDNLKSALLRDLEFLRKKDMPEENSQMQNNSTQTQNPPAKTSFSSTSFDKEDKAPEEQVPVSAMQASATTFTSNPLKEELTPTTKEERMKKLQERISALNTSVSVGGKTNLITSGADPYRL